MAGSSSNRKALNRDIKRLLSIGIPTVLTNISIVLMHVCDTWIVSRLGTNALAAIAPAVLLIEVLLTFGFFYLTSIIILVSQNRGRERYAECGQTAWQGLIAGALLGAGMIALLPLSSFIVGLYPNESPEVSILQARYFEISLFSILPYFLSMAIANFFIGLHQTRLALYIAVISNLLNFFFTFGLVRGRFGLPELGFAGAPWGTVCATTAGALIAVLYFVSPRMNRIYQTRTPVFSRSLQKQLARLGFPSASQAAVDILCWGVVLTWLVAFFGTKHQAAAAILIEYLYIGFMPAEGLAAALMTTVGYAIGNGSPRQARGQVKAGLVLTLGYAVGLATLGLVAAEPIMRLFSQDPEVIRIGVIGLRILAVAQVFDAANIIYLHALQGVGDTLRPAQISIFLSLSIVLGGGLLVVFVFPQLGSLAIWVLAFLYIALQSLIFRRRWRRRDWESIALLPE